MNIYSYIIIYILLISVFLTAPSVNVPDSSVSLTDGADH